MKFKLRSAWIIFKYFWIKRFHIVCFKSEYMAFKAFGVMVFVFYHGKWRKPTKTENSIEMGKLSILF